jgi:hypothetical protein
MYKIKVIITTNDETIQENTFGSFINGIISYKESDNTYVYLDTTKNELIRENDNLFMKYGFIENRRSNGMIHVKDLNKEIEIEIETEKIINEENIYYVEYKIDENKFIYKLIYEEE